MKKEGLTSIQVCILSIAAGVSVANIYYNQPILKQIAVSFNVAESRVGLVSVLSQIGYGTSLFFLTPVGDKVNRKKLILILQGFLILALLGMVLFKTMTAIYVASFLIGLFAVATQVILPMAASLDKNKSGKIVGLIFSGILIGILAARVFSGFIASWLSWHYVYLISSILVFITAVLIGLFIPAVRSGYQGSYLELLRSTVSQLYRFRLLREKALLGAIVFGIFCSFWTTLTFHLGQEPFGYSTEKIGLFGILAIGGALMAPVFGRITDKGSTTGIQFTMIGLIVGAIVVSTLFPESLIAIMVAVLFLDMGVQGVQVTNVATIYTLDTANRRINTIYMTLYFIGGAVGTLAGVFFWKAGGWEAVTMQLLISSGFAVLILLISKKHLFAGDSTWSHADQDKGGFK